MKNKNLIIVAVVMVIAGATGFFGGMKYQQNQRPSFSDRQLTMGGQRNPKDQGGSANLQGNTPVSGEIISQDNSSITVKMQDGSSKIIILSDKTSINKASEGIRSDLKTGEKITVFGTTNTDGSITAQNISIGGNMMFRGGQNN